MSYKLNLKKRDMLAILHEYFPDIEDDISLRDIEFSHYRHTYYLRFHQHHTFERYKLTVDVVLGTPIAVLEDVDSGAGANRRVMHPSPRWLYDTGCLKEVC